MVALWALDPMTDLAEALLRTWFADAARSPEGLRERFERWFSSSPEFDASLRESFADLPDRAARGELAEWRDAPRSALALVLALDQLPRNFYRDSARTYAYDRPAVEAALDALDRGFDRAVHPVEAIFFYLPLEHAEDALLQSQCVELFRELAARAPAGMEAHFEGCISYAERHRAVVDRFGRFPHRNRVLGRASTRDEERYLEEGGETFSGAQGSD